MQHLFMFAGQKNTLPALLSPTVDEEFFMASLNGQRHYTVFNMATSSRLGCNDE
jgi:hypothetical protein